LSDSQTFQLQGPSPQALLSLGVLVVVLPAIVTAVALNAGGGNVRGDSSVVLLSVVLVALAVFAALAVVATRRELRVGPEGLMLKSSFYKLSLDRSVIDVDGIRAVDSRNDKDFSITLRTNGIAFPGYRSGWFRTRNRAKAFVVSAGSTCVALPTNRGFMVLLGAPDPERAAAQLKAKLT